MVLGTRFTVSDTLLAPALAVARARDRVQAHVVRLALGIEARAEDADALAFEHRKGDRAEIEHDVADVVVRAALR